MPHVSLSPEYPSISSSFSARAARVAALSVVAPAIDASASAIDELAFVLSTDQLSMSEKIGLLEQWRYDMLQLDIAAGEGLGATRDDGVPLQQINKALLQLARYRRAN